MMMLKNYTELEEISENNLIVDAEIKNDYNPFISWCCDHKLVNTDLEGSICPRKSQRDDSVLVITESHFSPMKALKCLRGGSSLCQFILDFFLFFFWAIFSLWALLISSMFVLAPLKLRRFITYFLFYWTSAFIISWLIIMSMKISWQDQYYSLKEELRTSHQLLSNCTIDYLQISNSSKFTLDVGVSYYSFEEGVSISSVYKWSIYYLDGYCHDPGDDKILYLCRSSPIQYITNSSIYDNALHTFPLNSTAFCWISNHGKIYLIERKDKSREYRRSYCERTLHHFHNFLFKKKSSNAKQFMCDRYVNIPNDRLCAAGYGKNDCYKSEPRGLLLSLAVVPPIIFFLFVFVTCCFGQGCAVNYTNTIITNLEAAFGTRSQAIWYVAFPIIDIPACRGLSSRLSVSNKLTFLCMNWFWIYWKLPSKSLKNMSSLFFIDLYPKNFSCLRKIPSFVNDHASTLSVLGLISCGLTNESLHSLVSLTHLRELHLSKNPQISAIPQFLLNILCALFATDCSLNIIPESNTIKKYVLDNNPIDHIPLTDSLLSIDYISLKECKWSAASSQVMHGLDLALYLKSFVSFEHLTLFVSTSDRNSSLYWFMYFSSVYCNVSTIETVYRNAVKNRYGFDDQVYADDNSPVWQNEVVLLELLKMDNPCDNHYLGSWEILSHPRFASTWMRFVSEVCVSLKWTRRNDNYEFDRVERLFWLIFLSDNFERYDAFIITNSIKIAQTLELRLTPELFVSFLKPKFGEHVFTILLLDNPIDNVTYIGFWDYILDNEPEILSKYFSIESFMHIVFVPLLLEYQKKGILLDLMQAQTLRGKDLYGSALKPYRNAFLTMFSHPVCRPYKLLGQPNHQLLMAEETPLNPSEYNMQPIFSSVVDPVVELNATPAEMSVGAALVHSSFYLGQLAERLKLTIEEEQKARESFDKVKQLLNHHNINAILSGSVARGTAISLGSDNLKLHDVDCLAILPDRSMILSSPQEVLARLMRGVLNLSVLGEQNLRLQKRSVGIKIDDTEFPIDVVPVFLANNGTIKSGPFLVPDASNNSWIHSDPLYAMRIIDALEGEWLCDFPNYLEMGIKSHIRLLKYWNEKNKFTVSDFDGTVFQIKPIKSYHLELLCYDAVLPAVNDRISTRLLYLFKLLARNFPHPDFNPRPVKEIEIKVGDLLGNTVQDAIKAVDLETKGNHLEAKNIWERIFNIKF